MVSFKKIFLSVLGLFLTIFLWQFNIGKIVKAQNSDEVFHPETNTSSATNLNPTYLPFLFVDDWQMESSWDRTGGNDDDSKAAFSKEGDKWVLINKEDVSGMITRIWMAHPIAYDPAGGEIAKLEIYTDWSGPPLILDFNQKTIDNIPPFSHPLLTDGLYSSGGLISYSPIVFNGRLKILSESLDPERLAYFQINYTTASEQTSDNNEVSELVSLWKPSNMGQLTDVLSAGEIDFTDAIDTVSEVSLLPENKTMVFSDSGKGVITKIAFPADKIEAYLDNLSLKVNYPGLTNVAVNLPLSLAFMPREADYISDLPPDNDIDAHVFSPTGKEIVIKNNTVWVREPFRENYQDVGKLKNWYRASLAVWLSGSGDLPPSDNLDTYSIQPDGSETVIKGDRYWWRKDVYSPWGTGLLASIWTGASLNGYPLPHNNIDSHAFDLNGNETIISGLRYWYSQAGENTWWSGTLEEAWDLPLDKVDGHSFSSMGETVISGNIFWFRVNPQTEWFQGNLTNAWRDESKFYRGSLFFGYDPVASEYYFTWPMPFWNGIEISLENNGSNMVNAETRISWTRQSYEEAQAGYLNITYVDEQESEQNLMFKAAHLNGRGKFVGVIVSADGTSDPQYNRTFLEGDEKISVDGVIIGNGTGLEDFFGGGWYFIHGPFYLPTHGAMRSPSGRLQSVIPDNINRLGMINLNDDQETIMYRHFLNDAINFQQEFDLQFEFGPYPGERLAKGYSTNFKAAGVSYLSAPAFFCSTCSVNPPKSLGNANCDEIVNGLDFGQWRSIFQKVGVVSEPEKAEVDFNCQEDQESHIIDAVDFKIMVSNYFK
ncbi:DUF2961 domain-containing protein [Patescibacteria group bacterium]|nr:DUF2961 domain-containing protein [Patescibacteria group bacterium]